MLQPWAFLYCEGDEKMIWKGIREFLNMPPHFIGKGVGIAIVDGCFFGHPDIEFEKVT